MMEIPTGLRKILTSILLGLMVIYANTPEGKKFIEWSRNYKPIRKRSQLFFW